MKKLCILISLASLVCCASKGTLCTDNECRSSERTHGGLLDDIPLPRQPFLVHNGTEPMVLKVSDNVYQAVGYSFASVVMVTGATGVVIVDAGDGTGAADRIAREFRKITALPTVLVIYTHFHGDHIHGAKAFSRPGDPPPEVWAHENFILETSRLAPVTPPYIRRNNAFYGVHVGTTHLQQTAPGVQSLYDSLTNKQPSGFLPHTHLITGDIDVNIAGLTFSIVEIPGETEDQIAVWFPETRLLICSDIVYKSFPNLGPARGTPPRDTQTWISSLGKIRALEPEILVPMHYSAVYGHDAIQDLLSVYVSAVKFVHDQTVRSINQDTHPHNIARTIRLPHHLRTHPWLQELYGTIASSSRGVYSFYMGWFSSYVEDLLPIGPKEKADRIVSLVGRPKIVEDAWRALRNGDHQWTLELASYIFRADPDDHEAVHLRRLAVKRILEDNTSSIYRFFLMTSVLEDAGLVADVPNADVVSGMPLEEFVQQMRYRLKSEMIPPGEQTTGCFYLRDILHTCCLRLRYHVIEILPGEPEVWDFRMTSSEMTFRKVVMGFLQLRVAVESRQAFMEGSFDKLETVITYLDH